MPRHVILVALIAIFAAEAASATPQRRFDEYRYTREESDRAFAEYSECVIAQRSGLAQATTFLRLVPNSAEWVAAGQKLSYPKCLSGLGTVRLSFDAMALRPAMFAALYRRKFGKAEPVSLADQPALSLANLFDGSTAGFPPMVLAQLTLGNCMVRADTVAVHRLLMARPWTKAEDAALPAVTQVMGGCLRKDQTVRLTRSAMRGVVAEAMYGLSSLRAASAQSTDASATKAR